MFIGINYNRIIGRLTVLLYVSNLANAHYTKQAGRVGSIEHKSYC